jgi:hypothetical protein
VSAMEDVLEVYARPRDPSRPLVCLDETSKQLTRETRVPLPMEPGRPARVDYRLLSELVFLRQMLGVPARSTAV